MRHAILLSLLIVSLLIPASRAGETPSQAGDTVPVIEQILGLELGQAADTARQLLAGLGTREVASDIVEGASETWTLDNTRFHRISVQVDSSGRVARLSGSLRPHQRIPFTQLGSLDQADSADDFRAVWTVGQPGDGYRVIAKGQDRLAHIVYLQRLP